MALGCLGVDPMELERFKARALKIVRSLRDPGRCLQLMRAKVASFLGSSDQGVVCEKECVEDGEEEYEFYSCPESSPPLLVDGHGRRSLPISVGASLTEDEVIETDFSESWWLAEIPDENFMEPDSGLCLKPMPLSMVQCVIGDFLVRDDLQLCQGSFLLESRVSIGYDGRAAAGGTKKDVEAAFSNMHRGSSLMHKAFDPGGGYSPVILTLRLFGGNGGDIGDLVERRCLELEDKNGEGFYRNSLLLTDGKQDDLLDSEILKDKENRNDKYSTLLGSKRHKTDKATSMDLAKSAGSDVEHRRA